MSDTQTTHTQLGQGQSNNRAKEMTFWMTRDSDEDGNLHKEVDVWLVRPTRYAITHDGRGAVWMVHPEDLKVQSLDGEVPARFATWSLSDCMRKCHVVPETDRECVRVGE